jgi:hypothetical protein
MAGHSFPTAALLLLVIPLLITAVPGMEVAVQPESIVDQDYITVSLINVTDGTLLNTSLTTTFRPVPGVTWLNTSNWNYPFALNRGRVAVSAGNANQIVFLVRAGGTYLMRRVTGTGNITIEIPLDLQPLTSHDFNIGYEIHDPKAPLVFTLVQQGYKAGTESNANLTPSLKGIGEGNITVAVLANGTLQGGGEIRVFGTAPPPPTPPQVNDTATPTPAPTSPETTPSGTTPSETTSPAPTPPEETPAGTTPPPATPRPPQVTPATTPPAAAPAPAGESGPSPLIIAYAAIIVLIAVIADYILLKD